jgi:hypothetical protein
VALTFSLHIPPALVLAILALLPTLLLEGRTRMKATKAKAAVS